VVELEVYRTLPCPPTPAARRFIERGIDVALLYGPSAAGSLRADGVDLGCAAVVCVGPTTAHAARAAGIGGPIVPATYGDDGVVDEVLAIAAAVHASRHGVRHACT
jgi:uroporphyrinogen-III synthase